MAAQKLHILVIEDQAAIAKNIVTYFERKGHILDFAGDGLLGLKLALENVYDVVVLDLMLPGMDGLQVCRNIRRQASRGVQVLMLTARDRLPDKVAGFEHGADDYLTKPFALEELEVRCIALSRRHLLQTEHIIEIGPLKVDRKLKRVEREGKLVPLHQIGYKIVETLEEVYPQVVTRSELIHKIWGDEPTESDALRSHIYQIRTLLDKPFDTSVIKTVHGLGFALDC